MVRREFLMVVFIALTSVAVLGHSNILYDVSLDFDVPMKDEVTTIAQEHYKIKEVPRFYDYDRELITVKFNRSLEYSVTVNPSSMVVHGMRNDAISKQLGSVTVVQRKSSAQNIFDAIPASYQEELRYGEEIKLYNGVFKHTWYRYVDGIFVANDHLEVEVNPKGEIVAWRLSPFFYPSSSMNTIPAISSDVAQLIAQIQFNGKSIPFPPILVIYGTDPVWVVKVKTLYPIYVGVNALTGGVIFTGGLRTQIPEGYSVTKQHNPTPFINEVHTS